jgi:hypothetical protein
MPKRKNKEELREICIKDYHGGSQLEKSKSEDIIDIKDIELMEKEEGDIFDDGLIFKYIHKKFGGKRKNTDNIVAEVDPLEGTSSETKWLNR